MKVPELKALAEERGLKRYSKLRKAELIALLQIPPPAPADSSPQQLVPDLQDLIDLFLPHLLFQINQMDQDNLNY